MSKLTDRVSYLKGLADGLKLNMDKSNNQLLLEIINTLGDFAEEMDEMQEDFADLNEFVESIDEDLADLEEALLDEDDEEAWEDDEDDLILYNCPHCDYEISLHPDEVDFDEDTVCPSCGQPIFPELADEDEVEEPDSEE